MGLPGTVLWADSSSRPGVLPTLRNAVHGERQRRRLQAGTKTFGLVFPVEDEKTRASGAFKQRCALRRQLRHSLQRTIRCYYGLGRAYLCARFRRALRRYGAVQPPDRFNWAAEQGETPTVVRPAANQGAVSAN